MIKSNYDDIDDVLKTITPLTISYINKTDKTKTVSCFELFKKNSEDIDVIISTNDCDMDYLKKYFYEYPHLSGLIRIESKIGKLQYEKVFYEVSKNVMGEKYSQSAFIPIDFLIKDQFQNGILDIEYAIVLDGLSKDLEFDLLPNNEIKITIYFQSKLKQRTLKHISILNKSALEYNKIKGHFDVKYLDSFIIENTSNEIKEVYLFDDMIKYLGGDIKIINLFSGKYVPINYKPNPSYFNALKIIVTKGNELRQVTKPIKFDSGNIYFPFNEELGFQQGVCQIETIGEEFSSENKMKTQIFPNTRVCFIFKKTQNVNYEKLNLRNSFIHIEIENKGDLPIEKINILHNIDNEKLKCSVIANKISDNGYTHFSSMKILFYNRNQAKIPIHIGDDSPLFPMAFIDEYSFHGMDIFKLPFYTSIEDGILSDNILTNIPNKGDGMHVIISNEYDKSGIVNELVFQISIQNTNAGIKHISLANSIHDCYFPEGVIITTEDSRFNNYNEFLNFILKIKNDNNKEVEEEEKKFLKENEGMSDYYKEKYIKNFELKKITELRINKLISENTSQLTQIWAMNGFKFDELYGSSHDEDVNVKAFIPQVYFSDNQFITNSLDISEKSLTKHKDKCTRNGYKYAQERLSLDLDANINEKNKISKISTNLLGNTTLNLILELS